MNIFKFQIFIPLFVLFFSIFTLWILSDFQDENIYDSKYEYTLLKHLQTSEQGVLLCLFMSLSRTFS